MPREWTTADSHTFNNSLVSSGASGLLVDFFDHDALADSVTRLLDDEETRVRLGKSARAFAIENYDLNSVCLPKQLQWVEAQ